VKASSEVVALRNQHMYLMRAKPVLNLPWWCHVPGSLLAPPSD
jgi:hypothetical protein